MRQVNLEDVDPHLITIECRRSLHESAQKARYAGRSASEWEEWIRRKGVGLVARVGEKELHHLICSVWRLP